MKNAARQRSAAMDVIRCLALFGVVSAHFFVYTGYLNTTLVGSRLYLFTVIRSVSRTCVPLFLMLSGYFLKNKQPTRQYYQKLIRTVSLYFLASGCCYLYKHGLSGTVSGYLLDTLGYQAATYSWYMEMYLGLFLLIPYLNILYNGLPGKESRGRLILTLLLLTSVTKVFNCFQYSPETGLQLVRDVTQIRVILPTWWQNLYPATYYLLGAWLKDYSLKISRKWNVLLLLLAAIGGGTLDFAFSYGHEYIAGPWQDLDSLQNVIQSVLLFRLLSGLEFKWISGRPAKFLSRISELTLSAFLVSCIFDQIIYSELIRYQPVVAHRLLWYPVTTVLVFTASLLLAWILEGLYQLIAAAAGSVYCRIRAR